MRLSHNRESVAKTLDEVCHAVQIEPHLQVPEYETFPSNATANDDDARVKGMITGSWFFWQNLLAEPYPKNRSDASKYHDSIKKNTDRSTYLYRAKLSFALFRSYFLCLQGCRSTQKNEPTAKPSSAIVLEGRLSVLCQVCKRTGNYILLF